MWSNPTDGSVTINSAARVRVQRPLPRLSPFVHQNPEGVIMLAMVVREGCVRVGFRAESAANVSTSYVSTRVVYYYRRVPKRIKLYVFL